MTTSLEHLGAMLDELGPATPEVVLIEQATPNTWLIALEEGGAALAVKLDESTDVVTLSCELGRPQESVRERVYEALLIYNGLSALHGGIRMALREPAGVVLQEFDVHLQTLDVDGLRRIVQDFSRKAAAWEEIIESAEPPAADDALQGASWEALRV
jgi:hypothetical protein